MAIAVGIARATALAAVMRFQMCHLPLLAVNFRFGTFHGRNLAQLNREGNLFVKLQAPRHPPYLYLSSTPQIANTLTSNANRR
jgi:hypothetical protein